MYKHVYMPFSIEICHSEMAQKLLYDQLACKNLPGKFWNSVNQGSGFY